MSSLSLPRFGRDGKLGMRLGLASAAVFIVAVPFTALLALVDTHWEPLRRLDDDATASLHSYVLQHPGLVSPLRASSYLFHPWLFRGVILAMAGWLAYRGARRLALWAASTVVAGGLIGLAVKVLVGRSRPRLLDAIAHAPGGSFPSGHAMTAALGCAMIVLILLPLLPGARRWLAWGAATVITLVAGACRVALGVHYLSDVVAGWILGAAIVLATTAAFEAWRREEGRPPVSPAAEGIEPEAAAQISATGDPHDAPEGT
ncbi:phosphatase PAP2 family protein [Actinomadura scrupuli]|uniref:phosphatase PAP2 family protein n=1 Tax=Actinomadura scrupuli TaxID=559629 RepID=UPI003D9548F5